MAMIMAMITLERLPSGPIRLGKTKTPRPPIEYVLISRAIMAAPISPETPHEM